MTGIKNQKFIVTSRFHTPVPVFYLCDFLKERASGLMVFLHPFFLKTNSQSVFKKYEYSILSKSRIVSYWKISPVFLVYLYSFWLTIWWFLKNKDRHQIFIGLGVLDAFCGIFLKKLGLVEKVIYYSIDFVPKRFSNFLLNRFYHFLDEYLVKKSDLVWNLAEIMVAMREKRGLAQKYRARQITVPLGVDLSVPKKINYKANKIAFISTLRKGQGLEFLIDSLAIVQKEIPEIKLIIVGEGELRKVLERKIIDLGLEKNVELLGFIKSDQEVGEILADSALAVAPYEDSADCFVRYTDAGKVKTYLSIGLPVVLTDVPPIAGEIAARQCGTVAPFEKIKFAGVILKLLKDQETLKAYRQNVLNYGREISWERIFTNAFNYYR